MDIIERSYPLKPNLLRLGCGQRLFNAIHKVLATQGCKAHSLDLAVDVGRNNEGDDIEEVHPQLSREEVPSESEADGRGDPADLHDRPEAGLDSSASLVVGSSAGDNGHDREVNDVLDG